MPSIEYVERKFSEESEHIIMRANEVCESYRQQGYDLTLRQLYYQFVSRDWLPNTERSYKRLGSIVNDARLAGLLDWHYIVDRTRNLRALPHWNDPATRSKTQPHSSVWIAGRSSQRGSRCGLRRMRWSAYCNRLARRSTCPTSPVAVTHRSRRYGELRSASADTSMLGRAWSWSTSATMIRRVST
jgi:hypothetical protein